MHSVRVEFCPGNFRVSQVDIILVIEVPPGFVERFYIVELVESKDNVVVPSFMVAVLLVVVIYTKSYIFIQNLYYEIEAFNVAGQ